MVYYALCVDAGVSQKVWNWHFYLTFQAVFSEFKMCYKLAGNAPNSANYNATIQQLSESASVSEFVAFPFHGMGFQEILFEYFHFLFFAHTLDWANIFRTNFCELPKLWMSGLFGSIVFNVFNLRAYPSVCCCEGITRKMKTCFFFKKHLIFAWFIPIFSRTNLN